MLNYVDYRDRVQKPGWGEYSLKAYQNCQIFGTLFGGSPSEWSSRVSTGHLGRYVERLGAIARDFGLSLDYVRGINLADECINYQSGAHLRSHLLPGNFGCTSIGIDGSIGQTLDLFTVELCLVREADVLYVTMPPYLCLFGMNSKIAMCTNHLFDSVSFDGVPISYIRRSILDCQNLSEVVDLLAGLTPTTSVNFLVTDGDQTYDVEVSREGLRIIKTQIIAERNVIAHTNHRVNHDFLSEKEGSCLRLKTAINSLQDGLHLGQILRHPDIVQPISAGFGTIVTAWMNPKHGVLAYKDPESSSFTVVSL